MDVTFQYEGQQVVLEPRSLVGTERVGRAARFSLELFADEPASLRDLIGRSCAIGLGGLGQRPIFGVVTKATAIATSQTKPRRRYRIEVRSAFEVLELRRRCRVFQQLSAPEIVERICEEGGLGACEKELSGDHPPLQYITQYLESDAQFIRRVCEEHGLWWRLDAGDDRAVMVLSDSAAMAPAAQSIQLAEEAQLGSSEARAWQLESVRDRAAGKVTVRDYDFAKPALAIEGAAAAGVQHEQAYEIYVAPERSKTSAEADNRAQLLLESVRAESSTLRFDTSALSLRPGVRVSLEATGQHSGIARADEELFVVQLEHRWRHGEDYECKVTATPTSIPYRLARDTPRPKISGVHSAVVTGPVGEEIFTDAAGCVRVRFLWDREGHNDDGSSLPIRVLQPNLQGSMLIPRIGWEVWVAFEDGDPDRPYVLGRAFNGKHMPPVSLPENKTMTSLSTSSSPGAGAQNFLRYEDGAGRQGLSWNAGLAMERNIANNMTTQTMADEKYKVDGSQIVDVGGKQSESVTVSRVTDVPAQSITVGGLHQLKTPKAMEVKVGSETVAVGGALMEHVGSPGDAWEAAAASAASGVGGLLPGDAAQLAVGALEGMYSLYKGVKEKGVEEGVSEWFVDEINKRALGTIPGADAFGVVVDTIDQQRATEGKAGLLDKTLKKAKSRKGQQNDSTVGGAAGSGGAGPAASGSGDRLHTVNGGAGEMIGGAYYVVTPATSKWTTLGASSMNVGGLHSTFAGKVSWMTAGASVHNTGAYSWTGKEMQRDVRWLGTTIGAYDSDAGSANMVVGTSKVTLNCASLTVDGVLQLDAFGTEVLISGGNIYIKAAKVVFKGTTNFDKWHRL